MLGWVRRTRPVVAVLTDGSGHGASPRLALTAAVLRDSGAEASSLFGVATDRQVYEAILMGDLAFFRGVADSLADLLVDCRVDCVAGDAMEGYNPTHDICRMLIDRAVRLAEDRLGQPIANVQFPLAAAPSPTPGATGDWHVRLTPAELSAKVREARQYAERVGGMLATEVDAMVVRCGEEAFADEVLGATDTSLLDRWERGEVPFYESHGEERVAAGHYQKVIRYREHIAPIAAALRR